MHLFISFFVMDFVRKKISPCRPSKRHSVVSYIGTKLLHLFVDFEPHFGVRALGVGFHSLGHRALQNLFYPDIQIDLRVSPYNRKNALKIIVKLGESLPLLLEQIDMKWMTSITIYYTLELFPNLGSATVVCMRLLSSARERFSTLYRTYRWMSATLS